MPTERESLVREREKQPDSDATTKSRRWWFALLGVFLLTLVVPSVWVGIRYQQRLTWIEDSERRGGSFVMDEAREKSGPAWLRDLLGDDGMRPFEQYDEVSLVEPTDRDLERVLQCAELTKKFSLGLDQPQWTALGKEQLLRMESLTNLVIRGDGSLLDDPKLLAGLANLEYFRLSETTVTEEQLSNLEKLPHLETLFLYETRLTDGMLITIIRHTDLTGLLLARNHITDDVFLQISSTDLVNRAQAPFSESLEYLYLDEDDLTNKIIPALETFQRLEYLGLFNTRVTELEINELKSAMPDCRIQYGPAELYSQEK